MEIKHLLGFVSILLFFLYFFLSKYPTKSYLLFLLVMLPFIDLNVTPENFGSISVFDFISFFMIIITAKKYFISSKRVTVYLHLISVLFIILFIGSVKSEFIGNSLINLLKLFLIFIYAKVLIDECLQDPDFIKIVIKCLKLSCLFSLAFLCIQIAVGTRFTFYPDLNPNIFADVSLRYPSYFQDPQKYGQYLSMLSFLFLIKGENKTGPGKLNLVAFIIVILALLLTGSRAAFSGFCVGLLFFIFSQKKRVWIIIIVLGILGYFFALNFSEHFSLFNRADGYSSSFDTRRSIWQEGLKIFFANPLLGIGIGNHHTYIVHHSLDGYYLLDNEVVFLGTENGYLQLLIEFGILGFVPFILIVITPLINAIKSYKNIEFYNIFVFIAPILSWIIAFTTVNSLIDKRILLIVTTFLCFLVVLNRSAKSSHV